MKNRIVLIALGIMGLLWITYISFDLLKTDAQPNFLSFFNKSDERIVVFHEWKELDRNFDNIVLPPSNEAIINSLASKMSSASFYVSTTRPILVIDNKERWNKKNIETLFKNGIYPFKSKGLHRFTFGKFTGEYANNQLILYACDIDKKMNVIQVDRKATYSIVNLLSGGNEVCDVYKKQKSTYFYRKTRIGKNQCMKHNDNKLFASIIPDKFDTYSFFDKNYLALTEPVFKNSLFPIWINHGVVILRSKNRSLAIFDFKEGQNPIQNLNERLRKAELNEEFAVFNEIQFSSLLNNGYEKELYVAESDGFCLVSYAKDYLDEVLTEIKMGHSLSQNQDKLAQLFQDLPKKVTARVVDSKQTKAVSVIGRYRHEVSFIKTDIPKENEASKDRDYFAMNPGEKVIDFEVFNERGNVIALTESNKMIGYINGLKKWEKQLSGNFELKANLSERKYVCLFNKNECQLIDMYGKTQFRFVSAQQIVPEIFTLKSKKEFLVVTSPNNFSIFNDQGSIIKQFSCAGTIKDMSVQKTKKGTQMAMVLTNKMLYSIDLSKRKTILKMGVDSLYRLAKDRSGVFAINYQKGYLNSIDLQGKKSTYSVGNFSNDYKVFSINSGINVVLKNQNSLSVFDVNGKRKWNAKFDVNEISDIEAYDNPTGKISYVLLDGIENELYLLDNKGEIIDNSSKHGEQRLQLSGFGVRGFSITTYLGSFLIQYNK